MLESTNQKKEFIATFQQFQRGKNTQMYAFGRNTF